ncbi:hypothetical protein [Catellatospora tritici]|uniref:hypothetical protein n=1 Tax=Catellatospora tritici TaxID=2851566 RepID=UPI001C2CF652|nr:hypothetical protein [Catellatospora tritici]MBV1856444.1 hypothetical protein [Catellatospora tritici]
MPPKVPEVDRNALSNDLLAVLAKHGVEALPSDVTAAPATAARGPRDGSLAASYIREIITGDQAFDEQVLTQVSSLLARGGGGL